MRLLLLLCVLATAVACEPTTTKRPAGWPTKLVFGVTPYFTQDQTRAEQGRLVEYIGEQLELPTELRVTRSYGELSSQISSNLVHVADMAPFNYVRAKREIPELIILAIPIVKGSASYESLIVTGASSGITTLSQLRGRRFGFIDRRSASGYIYPVAYLKALGHTPERFFGSMEFAGSHDTLRRMVIDGDLDGGATFTRDADALRATGLRILATTGRIPQNAYCANPKLPATLIDATRRAFLGLTTESQEGRAVLRTSQISGFARIDDTQYDEVRRVARLVDEP